MGLHTASDKMGRLLVESNVVGAKVTNSSRLVI